MQNALKWLYTIVFITSLFCGASRPQLIHLYPDYSYMSIRYRILPPACTSVFSCFCIHAGAVNQAWLKKRDISVSIVASFLVLYKCFVTFQLTTSAAALSGRKGRSSLLYIYDPPTSTNQVQSTIYGTSTLGGHLFYK